MNKRCNVCAAELSEPIYASASSWALTSLCELQPGRVRVWSCTRCSHLLGDALADTEHYYGTEYRILLDHDDEDQIYELQGERVVYRTEHQVATLLDKLELKESALLLDYGCAKASTPRALLAKRPDLQVHLFDVSEMYREHWDRFVPAGNQAVLAAPAHWQGRFDVVTSFFALEHIPEPAASVRHVASLLSGEGVFYGIVPDTFGNVADFVVIDHVNHFTVPSLTRLLQDAGFGDVEVDDRVHRGALVFTARKRESARATPDAGAAIARSREIAQYWADSGERIRAAAERLAGARIAIYGSGFYGAYIYSSLPRQDAVTCFLDRSPYQQGKQLFGRPIIAPEQMPTEVRALFVGLNPAIARTTMSAMAWPGGAAPELVFLDGQ